MKNLLSCAATLTLLAACAPSQEVATAGCANYFTCGEAGWRGGRVLTTAPTPTPADIQCIRAKPSIPEGKVCYRLPSGHYIYMLRAEYEARVEALVEKALAVQGSTD